MKQGELALVLHAHLPYVRSAERNSLEGDWYFQALMESYLPLLQILEEAIKTKNKHAKITLGLSPTLLSLLEDSEFKRLFPDWISNRLELLECSSIDQKEAAEHLSRRIKKQFNFWNSFKGDVINRFAALQKEGVLDILTCAATHGYLPLLRETPESIHGQLKTAVREHERLFKEKPLGIWLPECAYYEGLDQIMSECGLKYAVLDGHGILHANPRPRYGLYAPICTKNGVAFFGRDSESTLPVWSAKDGYPGDSLYREFHKDIGWELPIEKLNKIGIKERRPLGLKLHKVTNQNISLEEKEIYDPIRASEKVKEHAISYLKERRSQLDRLQYSMIKEPLLVAPFDAELFGHWWFEGPQFLSEIFHNAEKEGIKLTRLRDVLSSNPSIQLCNPSPSSWGEGGYHSYWLNESNSWVVIEWEKASKEIVKYCSINNLNSYQTRILKQVARELLLSQSSDWSFILRAGTTTQLAKDRIKRHLSRFWDLIQILDEKDENKKSTLESIENEDSLFPLISIQDWSKQIKN